MVISSKIDHLGKVKFEFESEKNPQRFIMYLLELNNDAYGRHKIDQTKKYNTK